MSLNTTSNITSNKSKHYSMAPKLYMVRPSPPVRAVRMVAKAIGVELELEEIKFSEGEHLKPEYLKLNPQHTVPTLKDGDFVVWDSHAIVTYLVTKYAKNDDLYPKDPEKRAVIDQMLHFESGVLWSRGIEIIRPILFEGKKVMDQANLDRFDEALGFLNTFLERSKWVAGNAVTVADYSIFASVSSLNSFMPVDKKRFPKIVAWLKKMEKLPASQANVEGLALLTARIKSIVA